MQASPSDAAYATLARDKVDRYRSMGAFGKPAYQNHVQLKAMLRAQRGAKFADYLARPSVDPEANELRWTADVAGPVRRFGELSAQEQAEQAMELEAIRSGLIGFVQELHQQGGGQPGSAAAFATLLEQAMKVPAQGDFLYFVGKQPVIAFWGFQDQDGRSVDPSLVAPRFPAPPPLVGPAATDGPYRPMPVPAAPRKRPWWWWLLWGLLALALLAALLLALRACGPGARIVPDGVPPGTSNPTVRTPPDVRTGPDGGSGPGGTIGGSTIGGGTAGEGGVVTGPGTTTGPGAASAPSGDTQPADRTPPPDAPKDGDKPPVTPPDPAKDTTGPDGKTPIDPRGAKPPVDPKALKIPDDPADAGKMDFLQGDWRAGEGLADKQTQQPLDLSLKFGKDGKGELTLRRPDGTACSGPVQGRMKGGRLSVEGSSAIPCSGGGTYAPPKIECTPDTGGQTPCFGVNPDGSRYYMGIRRQ